MRKIVFILLSLAIGVFIVVLSLEIGLRVLGIGYPLFVHPHPVAGLRMWPNLEAWWTLEGGAYVQVNSVGFRDVEHETTKKDGEFRIAFLGDSFTAGLEVPFDDLYLNVANRTLENCPALAGRTSVPMNFGISGIGTAQELEILRHFVWDYDPDLVVLAVVSNDFTDNHPAFGGADMKPFYVFDDTGNLVLDDSFKTSPSFLFRTSPTRNLNRTLIQNSRTLQLLLETYTAIGRESNLEQMAKRGGSFNRPPETEKLRQAWKVTEATIALVAEDVASHGRDFLMLIFSTGHQVHPDPEYREKRVIDTNGGDLYYWNERLEGFAVQNDIAVLDLIGPLLEHAEATQECLHGFENAVPCGGHWNSEGHRLAGEEIAEAICLQLATQKAALP